MAYQAGSVVVLKSGGFPMTVVAASDADVECIWLGEEGELFRETIPAVALEAAQSHDDEEEEGDEEEEEEGDEDEEEDDEDEEDEEDEDEPKGSRAA